MIVSPIELIRSVVLTFTVKCCRRHPPRMIFDPRIEAMNLYNNKSTHIYCAPNSDAHDTLSDYGLSKPPPKLAPMMSCDTGHRQDTHITITVCFHGEFTDHLKRG